MSSVHPAPRASDQEREAVVERLRDAVADGRLTMEEFEERMTAAYAARTRPDLDRLLRDLPLAARALVTPDGEPHLLRVSLGSISRGRGWQVPPRLQVRLTLASGYLDLTDTVLPEVVDIRVSAFMSSLDLLVPAGVRVDTSALRTSLGSVHDRTRAPEDGPVVRVWGRVTMGSVDVKHPHALTGLWRRLSDGGFGPRTRG